MSSCPSNFMSVEQVESKMEEFGFLKDKTFSDPESIATFFKQLKEIPFFSDAPVRENVEVVVSYIHMMGAYVFEFISGCTRYVYKMNPFTYMDVIQGMGLPL